MKARPILLITALLLLTLWWTAPFDQSDAPVHLRPKKPLTLDHSGLHPLARSELREALAGDIALSKQLLEQWRLDAEALKEGGVADVHFLDNDEFATTQKLATQLLESTEEELEQLRKAARLREVLDETGAPLELDQPFNRFLPQTYSSASVLLALSDPEAIVALPRGLREDDSIFKRESLQAIRLDADRSNSEEIFNQHPDVAFVASYSLPSSVETLQAQGIKLFSYSKTDGVDEVLEGIELMGQIVNRPLKAQFLVLFVRAALYHLDNIAAAYGERLPERPLYLNLFDHLSTPTRHTLTSKLLKRVGRDELLIARDPDQSGAWRLPISLEEIASLNPDCIVICTSSKQGREVLQKIAREPALRSIDAVKLGHIVAVDESVQTSPSQYLVLAYYDLLEALLK